MYAAEPGTLEFAHPSFVFKESVGKALVAVNRVNGADGRIQVSWKTEDMTAINGRDFEGGEGVLVFEHGEIAKAIEIPIYDDQVSVLGHPFMSVDINLRPPSASCCCVLSS